MFFQHLEEALRLNIGGISLLSRNDLNGAAVAFRSAIQIMEALSQTDEAINQIRSDQEKPCFAIDMQKKEEVGSFFVFDKPLSFEVSASSADLTFYNAIIMFNLALTFHQAAMKRGHEVKFVRALHFYNMCANLIEDDQTASAGALLLAVLNNSAHAHLNLGAHKNFQASIKRLERQSAQLAQRRGSPPLFEQYHLEEMALNIMLAHVPTTAHQA